MKILQVTYTGFGGLGSVVFSLIGADREQMDAWSIGFVGDQNLDASYSPKCEMNGVRYASFVSKKAGRPYRAWLGLKRWMDGIQPDAIICHSINSVLACRWHTFLRNVPLIAVEHTPNQVKSRSEWAASRVCMLVADRVVVLTDDYRAELARAHGWLFRPRKVTVIPNGIDTAVFRPAAERQPLAGRVIKLGMAARFSFSKRQDRLVDSMARLATLRPDLSLKLAFAGDGPELARVQRLVADSPVADRICFDGLLDEESVAPWMRDLDIYVHDTEGETLSTSLLQAMATGLPILASDISGVHNLLGRSGEYGRCVENNEVAFASAISEMIDHPHDAYAMAGRARIRIEGNYSHQVMLSRYLALIEELL